MTFTYLVSDGELSVAGSALMDITPVNDDPTFAPNSFLHLTVAPGLPVGGLLFATDVESPSDQLEFSVYLSEDVQTAGFVILDENGEFIYLPPEIETGTTGFDQFQVMVTDPDGGSSITTVSITQADSFEYVNFVSGNYNDGALVGSLLLQDVFSFNNSIEGEDSGIDYLYGFASGEDLIELYGDFDTLEDILASESFDAASSSWSYTLADNGAAIISDTQLVGSDFGYLYIIG